MAIKSKLLNPEFAAVTLFSLVSMIGVGFGMFFIGREQGYEEMMGEVDELEAEVERLENIVTQLEEEKEYEDPVLPCDCEDREIEPDDGWTSFEDDQNSVSFKYPENWVLTQTKPADTAQLTGQIITKVTSPGGSELIYYTSNTSPGGVGGGCSLSDLEGLESPYNAKCTLVEGDNITFARLKDPPSEEIIGKWQITEKMGENDFLTSIPDSSFSYIVTVESDLEMLDSILKTVSRD